MNFGKDLTKKITLRLKEISNDSINLNSLQNPKIQNEKLKSNIPKWLRTETPRGGRYFELKNQLKTLGLSTVCQEAKCPNIGECWSDSGGLATATIMIMGDECTRACKFCSVKTSRNPKALDPMEPIKTAKAIASWNIGYVVITSVDRDDLDDGGSAHFAETIQSLKKYAPNVKLEVLIPDFGGSMDCLKRIVDAKPEVIAHNLETIERLQRRVRDKKASYETSLKVLQNSKNFNPKIFTKTSLMLGLGESDEEVEECLQNLSKIGVDCLTLGQYMQPTKSHLQVKKYLTPEKFDYFKKVAEKMNFKYVASGPLVRSSYKAGEYFMKNLIQNNN